MADSLLPDDTSDTNERTELMNKWKDKTKEEILEAKINSDLFIRTKNAQFDDLKKDYLTLREQHQASADLQTLLTEMKSLKSDTNPPPGTQNQPAISPEDIDVRMKALVAEQLNQYQLVTKQQENFNFVEGKLKEHFGNDYGSAYKQRLDTLGLTKDFADSLAKNHPAVFLKTFELDEAKPITNNSPPRTVQRAPSFAPVTPKRDWNYYQDMKKANPKLYLDPKIAIQMHNDAIELGDAFGMPQD